MLQAVLFNHLQLITATNILRNLYIDSIISKPHNETRSIISAARFNPQVWVSNCSQLIALAQCEIIANNTTLVNVLDLQYNLQSGSYHCFKCQVLQQSSQVFDPLDYLAPVMIQAKLFLRKLWQHKMEMGKMIGKESQV